MEVTPVQRFWRLLRQYRPEIRQIYVYAIFNGIVNLSLPLGIQAIINYIQTGQMTSSWVVLVSFVLLGIFITGLLQMMQLRIVENIQQDVFARSAFEFAYRIPKISFTELDKTHAPELVNRFFDTLTIQKGLPKILIDFSLASFQIIFGLILLTIYSSFFIILAFALIFILWLIFQFTGPRGLQTSLKESKQKYKLAHWLEEVARVNHSFKLYNAQGLHLKKTDEITTEYLSAREKHFGVLWTQFRLFIGFKVIVAAGLLILGGFLVFEEQMDIGQFVAAEIIIILIINSVEKMLRVIDTIYDVLTGLEKIGHVTDLGLDGDNGLAILDDSDGMEVKANDIEFSYPDTKKKIFDQLSFHIPKGSKVIVEGKTGSGKSTLLRIIGGIQHLDDGEIIMNQIPMENYLRNSLMPNIGMVFPTNQLFEGTIEDNICMGRDIPSRRVSEVLEVLDLSGFVSHQPNGIKSHIDSSGRRLPRSIIQRLLIARIIVGRPKLLLMEDPLQFVEDGIRSRIVDYIMSPQQNWTVIVVADHPEWPEKCTQTLRLS